MAVTARAVFSLVLVEASVVVTVDVAVRGYLRNEEQKAVPVAPMSVAGQPMVGISMLRDMQQSERTCGRGEGNSREENKCVNAFHGCEGWEPLRENQSRGGKSHIQLPDLPRRTVATYSSDELVYAPWLDQRVKG